jgi:hypothetical protein
MIGKLIERTFVIGLVAIGGWYLWSRIDDRYCEARAAEYDASLDTLAQYEVDMRTELARRGVPADEHSAATRDARTRCVRATESDDIHSSLICDVQRSVAPDLGDVRERERRLLRELTICLPEGD